MKVTLYSPVIKAAWLLFKVLNANLVGRGYTLTEMWIYMGSLGVNVICNFILIPFYGVIGSAAGSSVGYVAGAIVFAQIYGKMSDMSLKRLFYQPMNDWQTLKSTFANVMVIQRLKRRVTCESSI